MLAENVYVVISPVRNEAAFIRDTINSMVAQTILPAQWIIVDDGSTDDTAEIVRSYMTQYPWIYLVQRADRGRRQRGGGVVDAFNDGYKALTITNYQFIVKLDGDVSFAPNYFEQLLTQFAAQPHLGIGGGNCYVNQNGLWTPEETDQTHVRGATKMYRRACFEAIGGLVAYLGWDGIDEWQARTRGWQVQSFLDIIIYHHRITGAATGLLRGRIEQGRAAYFMGYHPLFMLFRSMRRMVEPPLILGGLALWWGYAGDWLRWREQINDPLMIQFLQKNQLQRLGLARVDHSKTI